MNRQNKQFLKAETSVTSQAELALDAQNSHDRNSRARLLFNLANCYQPILAVPGVETPEAIARDALMWATGNVDPYDETHKNGVDPRNEMPDVLIKRNEQLEVILSYIEEIVLKKAAATVTNIGEIDLTMDQTLDAAS